MLLRTHRTVFIQFGYKFDYISIRTHIQFIFQYRDDKMFKMNHPYLLNHFVFATAGKSISIK